MLMRRGEVRCGNAVMGIHARNPFTPLSLQFQGRVVRIDEKHNSNNQLEPLEIYPIYDIYIAASPEGSDGVMSTMDRFTRVYHYADRG